MEATWKLAHFLASDNRGIARDDEDDEESESESLSGNVFETMDLTNV